MKPDFSNDNVLHAIQLLRKLIREGCAEKAAINAISVTYNLPIATLINLLRTRR